MIFQPFDPTGRGRRKRRFLEFPLLAMIPSLITLSALVFGMTAIRMAIEGHFNLALACLFIAAILDGIDGRVARLLKRASRFGAELDSLADLVSFGVVPALILYMWGLNELGNFGWMIAVMFTVFAALRLARFNIALDEVGDPSWKANFFVGIPSPMAAIIVPLPIYLELSGLPMPDHKLFAIGLGLYVLVIGSLMVSNFPAYSGKARKVKVERSKVIVLVMALAFMLWLSISYPWPVISILVILYLSAMPFWFRHYQKLDAKHQKLEQDKAMNPDEGSKDEGDEHGA